MMKALVVALTTAFLLTVGTVGFSGCDQIKHSYDCTKICQRYSDCVDSSYDVDACTQRCKDSADMHSDFADKADDCQTCIEDKSCVQSFPCLDECLGIVP
jgi:hypothetical protein